MRDRRHSRSDCGVTHLIFSAACWAIAKPLLIASPLQIVPGRCDSSVGAVDVTCSSTTSTLWTPSPSSFCPLLYSSLAGLLHLSLGLPTLSSIPGRLFEDLNVDYSACVAATKA